MHGPLVVRVANIFALVVRVANIDWASVWKFSYNRSTLLYSIKHPRWTDTRCSKILDNIGVKWNLSIIGCWGGRWTRWNWGDISHSTANRSKMNDLPKYHSETRGQNLSCPFQKKRKHTESSLQCNQSSLTCNVPSSDTAVLLVMQSNPARVKLLLVLLINLITILSHYCICIYYCQLLCLTSGLVLSGLSAITALCSVSLVFLSSQSNLSLSNLRFLSCSVTLVF